MAPAPAPVRTGPEVSTSPIAWKTVDGIKAGDRPLLVWIADPTLDAAVEHRAFDDADVRLAANAFRHVRISPVDALRDPFLRGYAATAPSLLVFAPDLSTATVAIGTTISPRAVLNAARGAAFTYMHIDIDASIKRARTLLAEQASLTNEKTLLSGAAPSQDEAARRRARVSVIDVRLATIHTEVDGLFHARKS